MQIGISIRVSNGGIHHFFTAIVYRKTHGQSNIKFTAVNGIYRKR